MRVLGIDIQASDVIAVVLDGTPQSATVHKLNPAKMSFPEAGSDEADNLLLFERQLVAAIDQAKVDHVAVVRAIAGMYAASPIKVKIECLIQLAAKRNNKQCHLLAPQSVTKLEKNGIQGGETVKKVIEQLQPKYVQKAAYCAWSVLHAQS